MGQEKALLEVDAMPMWRRQRDILAAASAKEIFLSVRPGQTWARSTNGFTAVLVDALDTGGPLVGLTAGLERMTHPWLAVVATDMPKISADWFRLLQQGCRPGVGVVGQRAGFFEPLAAIYPREFMPLAWEALLQGKFSLQSLLRRAVTDGLMEGRDISSAEEAWFMNWNTPAAT
jgi:molybdopterin-guanine dinucleotide biosynthesis protein A